MIRFLAVGVLVLLTAAAGKAQLYRVDTLARAPLVQYPVTLSFAPDGSGAFFVTEKNSGRVRLYREGLQLEPFITLPVETEGEQGLLGVAVHPDYPDTPLVYVYYTRKIDRSNIVESYRDSSGVGVDPRLLLIVPRENEGTSNNGGIIRVGPDRCLYVTVGDYGLRPGDAQDTLGRRNYRGKILRINTDGTLPSDNPFPGKPIWAYGLRTGTGLAFDSFTGDLYCTDSGIRGRNMVFHVHRGANLGWPSGVSSAPPLVSFPESEQPALSGVTVYRGSAFPRLRGRLLLTGNLTPVLWSGVLGARGDSAVLTPLFRSTSGFADVQVGPDGTILLTNGPTFGSRLLRIAPVPPAFVSLPPGTAEQDIPYSYTPQFAGTPPSLRLRSAPEGMTVDTMTWSLRWIPTNAQALVGTHRVVVRAENGAGGIEQGWTIRTANVNDPPGPFLLHEPAEGALLTAVAADPVGEFLWTRSVDPDGDPVRYHLQIDTSATFATPFLRDTLVFHADTVRLTLPRTNRDYLWRVLADDGRLQTLSVPAARRLSVSYVAPTVPQVARDRAREPVAEQNFSVPFNPVTSITYTLARSGLVRLSIFNLLGQEVARVAEGIQSDGFHQVDCNGLDLPSGIYVYRLEAPGLFETKKMVIAR